MHRHFQSDNAIDDFKLDNDGLDLFNNNKPSNSLVELTKLVGFCPGSRHYTKNGPKEYYIELGKKLIDDGFNIVLFGGKDDMKFAMKFHQMFRNALIFATTIIFFKQRQI
ncbi:MAG: hypothetical protein MZV64_02895 [Ignavibacteriales bacterium]|nr:hypothetical protein [Ignavibacteriales bacterium]